MSEICCGADSLCYCCQGGAMEKETEASGVFEVDDAKCKGAQYDIKLDGSYKIINISRD